MSVYKEGIYLTELLLTSQRQIWNDAADYGVPTKRGDRYWKAAKQLTDQYGEDGTRTCERYSTGVTVGVDIEVIFNEHSETGSYDERTFHLEYVGLEAAAARRYGFDGYITITPFHPRNN